jgi:5-methylcytosine-specific restriction endonuclease McrA
MKLSDLNILDFGEKIGMTGAVFSSNDGMIYLTMFPEQPEVAKDNIEPLKLDLEDWKKMLRQLDLQETEVLVKDSATGEIAKAILRKSQRTIEQRVSWSVFKRDHYHCRYCGKDGVPMTVDHLILWEKGGPSVEENLVAACRPCNKARGDMEYVEWLQSPYYKKASRSLPMAIIEANEKLVTAIRLIPRNHQVRETRK